MIQAISNRQTASASVCKKSATAIVVVCPASAMCRRISLAKERLRGWPCSAVAKKVADSAKLEMQARARMEDNQNSRARLISLSNSLPNLIAHIITTATAITNVAAAADIYPPSFRPCLFYPTIAVRPDTAGRRTGQGIGAAGYGELVATQAYENRGTRHDPHVSGLS